MNDDPALEEIALAWAIRSVQPDFDDWEALMAWLAGDAARNRAYDRAMLIVADGRADEPRKVAFLPDIGTTARPSRARKWAAGMASLALAASIAAIMIGDPTPREPAWQQIEASADHPRSIVQPDGNRIDLASGGRMRIDPVHPRSVRLDRGRAVFTVRHDARSPYLVMAGGHRIVDAGTTFEVAHDADETRVGVIEGEVVVDDINGGMPVRPGQVAVLHPGYEPRVERVPSATIGQWRRPSMSYRQAPLSTVVADLSAALGQRISIDGDAGRHRFSGTITPASLRGKPDEAAALLDVRVVADRQDWKVSIR